MVGLRFSGFRTVLTDQISLTIQEAPLLVSAAALGSVVALFRRTFINRTLVFVVLSSIVIFSISFTYFRNFYVLHSLPLYVLLAGGAFAEVEKRLAENASNKNLHFIFAGLTALVIGASLGLLVNSLAGAESQSYEQALVVAKQIRLVVPKEETFVGVDPFYLEMTDYPSFIDLNAGQLLAKQNNIDELQAWEKIQPTSVAIVNGYPEKPTQGLLDYVTKHNFQRIRCWTTKKLGQVELFMESVPSGITPMPDCVPFPGAE